MLEHVIIFIDCRMYLVRNLVPVRFEHAGGTSTNQRSGTTHDSPLDRLDRWPLASHTMAQNFAISSGLGCLYVLALSNCPQADHGKQSIRDHGRFPDATVDRTLRVCKNHERKVTNVHSIGINLLENEEKKCSRAISRLNKRTKLRNGVFRSKMSFLNCGLVFNRRSILMRKCMTKPPPRYEICFFVEF